MVLFLVNLVYYLVSIKWKLLRITTYLIAIQRRMISEGYSAMQDIPFQLKLFPLFRIFYLCVWYVELHLNEGNVEVT